MRFPHARTGTSPPRSRLPRKEVPQVGRVRERSPGSGHDCQVSCHAAHRCRRRRPVKGPCHLGPSGPPSRCPPSARAARHPARAVSPRQAAQGDVVGPRRCAPPPAAAEVPAGLVGVVDREAVMARSNASPDPRYRHRPGRRCGRAPGPGSTRSAPRRAPATARSSAGVSSLTFHVPQLAHVEAAPSTGLRVHPSRMSPAAWVSRCPSTTRWPWWSCSARPGVRLERGPVGLLDLHHERVPLSPRRKALPATGSDAADANDLDGVVDQLVAVEQHAHVVRQGAGDTS